ncbi:MAG: hypothetical protein ACR2RE_00855 [Geminicoccaceae bacterium]
MASNPKDTGDSAYSSNLSSREYIAMYVIVIILLALFASMLLTGKMTEWAPAILAAALAVLFAALLSASGTFKSTGGKATGAAAIFLVILASFEGQKLYDQREKITKLTDDLKAANSAHIKAIGDLKKEHSKEIGSMNSQMEKIRN